jgi:TolB protein
VWSPVSNRIAFSWLLGKARELHVMVLLDRSNKHSMGPESRVTPAGVGVYRPDCSPDGTQIVYECSEDPCDRTGGAQTYNPNIYKVDADGSDNTPFVASRYGDSYPVFSPGGGKIVLSSDRDGDEELYIKNADGSGEPQQLTYNRTRDVEPDWQPVQ